MSYIEAGYFNEDFMNDLVSESFNGQKMDEVEIKDSKLQYTIAKISFLRALFYAEKKFPGEITVFNRTYDSSFGSDGRFLTADLTDPEQIVILKEYYNALEELSDPRNIVQVPIFLDSIVGVYRGGHA